MSVVTVESRIEHVTVYASGARVRRVTTIPTPLPTVVRIVGLPLSVVDDTVRVELRGPGVVRSVRTSVDAPATEAIEEESAELRTARRWTAIATAEAERLEIALELSLKAAIIESDPSDDAPAPWSQVIAARRALLTTRSERELRLREGLIAARREIEQATEAQAVLEDREARIGTTRAPKLHELRKYLELELVFADGATAPAHQSGKPIEIAIEYLVPAARWAPSYVARLDGEQVTFEIRAVVAQASGEDWVGAGLALSTAEPDRFAPLPELEALRIGRRQETPARGGFRAPPTGARELYADYVGAFPVPMPDKPRRERKFSPSAVREDSTYLGRMPGAPPPRHMAAPLAEMAPMAGLSDEVWDEESSRAKEAFHTPPAGSMPIQQGAGMARRKGGKAELLQKRQSTTPERNADLDFLDAEGGGGAGGGFGGGVSNELAPAAAPPRLDYGDLRMAPAKSGHRGALVSLSELEGGRTEIRSTLANAIAAELATTSSRLADLTLPSGCVAGWLHTYDYAFVADGKVDVRADGAWHSLAIVAKPGTAKVRHVAVPREQVDVFRVAAIGNPFAGPLLPGPIDVYDRGRFLVTSTVDFTPPGATVEIGLGVDPQVKLARNIEFREEATGMLRGGLRLVHAITIDVENLSPRPIDVEVRDRVPVIREGDDDIEITIGKIDPAWERWIPEPEAPRERRLRGGHRWRLAIAPGAKRTLRAGYEVKIASKHELVGGNRRES